MAKVIEFYVPEKFRNRSGEWIPPEQRGKIIPFPALERTVAIDLKDVLVDREAVKFLARRESNVVELRNCPAYIREWIKRERTDANGSRQATEGREDINNV